MSIPNGYIPFYIASFEQDSGLNTYYEPFIIPEKAFPVLEDAYAWRGRIKKKQGYSLIGRLRRVLTSVTLSTQANGASYTVADILADSAINVRSSQPNAEILPGSVLITVGGVTFTDNTAGVLVGAPNTNSGTINYVTGALSLSFNPALGVATNVDVNLNYYPSLPVMGLRTKEINNINDEETIAFDTTYAYRFVGGAWEELPSTLATTWKGTNYNFFWTTNYYQNSNGQLFWATNFNKGSTPDPLYYYDTVTWVVFEPAIDGTNFLEQAQAIVPYKDRLVVINTWEGASLAAATNFPQRIRWSQNGDPTDQTNGWLDNTIGRGGYLDLSTNEEIISCEFVKDVLLIKCERSSWKLLYTGNEVLPFVAQKINTELGTESTFSVVPFDRGVFSVGNVGITVDDSVNVSRIDQTIPQIVFNFNNNQQGVQRVYGIRDYGTELVYWTFANAAENPTYPNKVLVYNYVNQTYAIFNDSFTCYGYFQQSGDYTWATLPYASWSSWDEPWDSGTEQSGYPDVCAGNQQGYVLLLNQGIKSSQSLAITLISPGTPVTLTIPNHNLQTGQFIKITSIIGSGSPNPNTLNNQNYKVVKVDSNKISLLKYNSTTGNFDSVPLSAGGTYLGGGEITVISNINICTKRFSPFYDKGDQVRLGYVDFFVDKTSEGEISINCYIDENTSIPINDPNNAGNSGLLGDNVILTSPSSLVPFQQTQEKLWSRLYLYSICQNFQLQFTLDDVQMVDDSITEADFNLHAMTLYLSPNARMIQ